MRRLKLDGKFACADCYGVLSRGTAPRCSPCANKRRTARRLIQGAAATIVARAVRHGELAPINTLSCVDCGSQAEHYEHRDYTKPLDVEPVCRKCNFKRGPAVVWAVHEPNCAPIAGPCHPQGGGEFPSSVGTPTHSAKVTA